MPTFKFRNTETGEEFDDFLSNSRREELLEKNPHIKQVPTSFGIVSTTGTIDGKTDGGWKEVLSRILNCIQIVHLQIDMVKGLSKILRQRQL